MTSRLTAVVAALAAGVTVLGGVAVVAHGDSGAGGRDLVITAEAQRRTLTDDVTLKGTVGRVEQRKVDAAAPGLVDAVHIEDGATVEAGQALLSLDGRDAVAVPGDLPFFRDLDVGARGPDVRQLEAVLAGAGFQPGPVDELYTEQTRFALAQWQAQHGYPGATPEHPETVAVSLTQGSGYKVGAEGSTGVTIGAGAPATGASSGAGPASASLVPARGTPRFRLAMTGNPVLTIRSVNAVTAEGGMATFEIAADDTPISALEVHLSMTGSAGADDVVAPLGPVTFPAGAWSITVNIPTRQDDLVEDDETLLVAIATSNNYRTTSSVASTRIVSDDVPELSVVGGGRVAEGSSATVVVVADQAPVHDTQVALSLGGDATAGRDYRTIDPLVTLAAGNTTATLTIDTLSDDVLENDERLVVAVGPGGGYRVGRSGSGIVTIASRSGAAGLPVVTLRPTATKVAEGQPFPLTLSLDHSLTDDLPITLTYGGTAVVGSDFTPVGGRLVVPAGQTTLAVQVPTVQDATVEPDRVLSVGLAASDRYRVGNPSAGTATVESDDLPELRLVGGGNVTEGRAAPLRVVADQAPAEDTSIGYQVVGTATPGQDFSALTGTAVLRAGQTSLTIPLLTLADDVVFQAGDMVAGHWPIRVGQVLVKAGAAVTAGTPLLSLTDAGLTVTLKANASDRTKLKVAQKVTVKLEGGSDEVDGVISELDDTATTDEQSKAQSYEGKVTIGELAAADGASVTIDVILDQRADTLTLPIAAVKQDGAGHDVVRVLDLQHGGRIREVPVKTGISEGSYIEIRSGIAAGDVVIVEVDKKA